MSLAPIGGGRTLTSPDAVPARRPAERLEEIARELMTVTAMLRSAELRNHVCSAETVERAKQALTAATPEARQALRAACEPSTLLPPSTTNAWRTPGTEFATGGVKDFF